MAVGGTLAGLLLAAGPVRSQGVVEVGSVETLRLRSEQMAGFGAVATANGWELEIHHPGASYLALHFDRFDLQPGEAVTISDPTGRQSLTLRARGKRNAGSFWARHVKGDTVRVEFATRRAPAVGFEIDRYAAGSVDLNTTSSFTAPGPEAICGTDDKKNAVCYEDSHPAAYDHSRAVARLLIQGVRLCTGWLASTDNHLITNEHCITDASDALNTDYEFMAETSKCNRSSCVLCDDGTVFSGATFIQDDVELDYALVRIDGGDPAATYGYLEIDDRSAVTGERIYIPQHPGGFAKEIAIESSDPNDPGWCEVDGFTEACTATSFLDVGYQCDTKGGSSGSPVLSVDSNRVIALHHCADCLNRGVPINLIYDQIGPIVNPMPCTLGVDDLMLHDDTVVGSEIEESCSTVTTGTNYTVSAGGDLTLRTRDRVALGSGTAVATGGELRVELDPMTGAP